MSQKRTWAARNFQCLVGLGDSVRGTAYCSTRTAGRLPRLSYLLGQRAGDERISFPNSRHGRSRRKGGGGVIDLGRKTGIQKSIYE